MKNIIIMLTTLLTFTSCFKERIELDNNTDENKKIVITGWITPLDEPQFIEISQTVNYLGSFTPDRVSGAIVTIEDAITTYDLEEREAGFYYLPEDWTARVGDDYKLRVEVNNKTYTSVHKMRPCPEIENPGFEISEDYEEDDEDLIFDSMFSFQDFEGEGDGYYAATYPKGTMFGDSLIYGESTDDSFVDGQYFKDITLSTGVYYTIGDTAIIDFFSIGLESSDYLQEIENEIFRGSLFDAPPANVRTNIEGGAIGYFIASDARRAQFVLE